MVLYSFRKSSFLLSTAFILTHVAATPHGIPAPNTSRKPSWTWPIMFRKSRVTYLNLSTLEYPKEICTKEYAVKWNHSARAFIKKAVVIFSSWKSEVEDVVYKPRRVRGPARTFTALNSSGYLIYTIHFNYTSKYCAIIRKENHTKEDDSGACELWVNHNFFEAGPVIQNYCTENFKKYCKQYNATRFDIKDCFDTSKPILFG
uniref:Putative group iv salivary lipocalin n=1 Tax=Rhipicephalus microplus TaxID=6941 RepID=A0A6G5A609_RHIMP